MSAGRNAGIALTTGGFLVFLDADDRLLPRALESEIDCLQSDPAAGLVYGTYRIIDQEGRVQAIETQPIERHDHYRKLLRRNLIGTPAAVMVRREAIESVGGFDPAANMAADYDLYLKIARNHTIQGIDEFVAEYRRHSQNHSARSRLLVEEIAAMLRRELSLIARDKALRRTVGRVRSETLAYFGGRLYWDALGSLKRGEVCHGVGDLMVLLRDSPGSFTRCFLGHLAETTRLAYLARRIRSLGRSDSHE